MTARFRSFHGLVAFALPLALAVACATQPLKLEMERQVVITPPKLESLTAEPQGRLDTRDQDRTVKVTLRGDPGLIGSCEATIGQATQTVALSETRPGTYEGAFSVRQGQEGMVNLVGHLLHEPTGAHQEIRQDGILQLYQSVVESGPEPGTGLAVVETGCSGDAATRFESKLREFTVHFDFDRADLRKEAIAILDSAAPVLRGSAECRIVLAGHTDEVGSDQYNQTLSERRARAVEAYVSTRLGIGADRLKAMGYGKTRLADRSGTPEAQKRNRRVELHAAGAP